jgi:hypothetical protein
MADAGHVETCGHHMSGHAATRAEATRERLPLNQLNTAADGIIVAAADGRILNVNPSALSTVRLRGGEKKKKKAKKKRKKKKRREKKKKERKNKKKKEKKKKKKKKNELAGR